MVIRLIQVKFIEPDTLLNAGVFRVNKNSQALSPSPWKSESIWENWRLANLHLPTCWILESDFPFWRPKYLYSLRLQGDPSPEGLIMTIKMDNDSSKLQSVIINMRLELILRRIWICKYSRSIDSLPVLKDNQHFKEHFCKNRKKKRLIYIMV